ncbi:MAG: tRNA lysidine(34) synthetase TilS [Treponema sp.]|jgi:tRNA(Ile)-lysidine synthase|nr:tRNA lysidine(34) synthetase TilS [Treponema sp.]
MNDFEKKIAGGLGDWSAGSLFLTAVSGGADSTALLVAMAGIAGELGFTLRCLHVDHGIRPEAERHGDAEAVERLCARFDVPCAIAVIPPGEVERTAKERGIGIEAAARLFRHRAWEKEAARVHAERVLVAHTEDDLLETILMRFLRGSGPAGLAGMKRERPPALRPMLSVTRAEVLRYLEARGISFRTDSTNNDTYYLRNRIRLKLIPFLDAFFSESEPDWRKNALAGAETQRYVADFLEEEASARVKWINEADGCGKKVVATADFFSLPEILREESLFRAIDGLNQTKEAPPKRSALRLFCQGRANAVDTGKMRVTKEKGRVVVAERQKFSETGFALLIHGESDAAEDQSEEQSYGLARGMLIKKKGRYIMGKEIFEAGEGPFPAVIHSVGNGKIAVDYSGGGNG